MRAWRDDAREHARHILTQMLLEVNPQTVLRRHAVFDGRTLHLPGSATADLHPSGGKLHLLAMGKAAAGMAAAAQRWGPFHEAVVIAPHDAGIPEFECLVGDHPMPTARSVRAGERALEIARATGPDDVLLLLLSGGTSALAEAPSVPLEDLRRTTDLLLRSSADILEINVVRRHLSRLKGGGLLRATQGRVVVLAISDVTNDDIAALASGPAAADPTTFADAWEVLERYGLSESVPRSVREHLRAAKVETIKPGDPALSRVTSRILACNEDALRAGARAAEELGYAAQVRPEWLRGEARDRGRDMAALARDITRPSALFFGGETVVRVLGAGRGGRNQEVALAAVDALSGRDAVLACLGTDGVDGPTDAAGAIVDGHTRARAEALGLDAEAHLLENDSHAYFDALDDLIRTGPTGTNVRDVAVLLVR